MSDTVYVPDTAHEDYGLRRGVIFGDRPALELGEILDVGWPTQISDDRRHLWMTGVLDGKYVRWGLCPKVADMPELGRTLLLRGLAGTGDDELSLRRWADRQRHFFGRGMSITLAMPVIVSDALHQVTRCA